MRFRNQESGIGNPESGSISGLFCNSAIQKRPGTATPDSRFLIPESHVCGNGLYLFAATMMRQFDDHPAPRLVSGRFAIERAPICSGLPGTGLD